MPNAFQAIPGWFSWENAGGNIAVADLERTGNHDLLVITIYRSQPGPNRGIYRVGKALDANGNVTGNWGPWIDIPDWFSFANQGCAIAVADLSGTGQLDLLVFTIDHRVPGPNRGMYQIGRNLDQNGNVQSGWTGWIDAPNWFSWDNQAVAVAVTDLIVPPRKDLVVFTIDHRVPGPNRGIYQIASGINRDGQVSDGWSGWIDVDWFSWENQGAGIALRDLDDDGIPELAVFQIDHPNGPNAGMYRIGWRIGGDGISQDGWGRWNQIPDWNSWEDQGGGIALVDFGAGQRPQAVVFHIDNAIGLNQGWYRVLPLAIDLLDEANTKGIWRLLSYDSDVLPIHAALLHTGRILFFAGSGNNYNRARNQDLGHGLPTSVIWDITQGHVFRHPASAFDSQNRVIDLFCCGHTFLADGRLLAAGGTFVYDLANNGKFLGRKDAVIFDPNSEAWSVTASMQKGRWYPTVIELGDGRVLAAAGLDDQNSEDNGLLEIYDPGSRNWTEVGELPLPLYAHLFLLQNGSIFYTGGKMSGGQASDDPGCPQIFNLNTNPPQLKRVGNLEAPDRRYQSASVLLGSAQDQVVMLLGGGSADDDDPLQATELVGVVDLSGDLNSRNPAYAAAEPLHFRRMHLNAVLLPDRSVLATGGSGKRENPTLATLDCEIFDPGTGHWSVAAEGMIPRMYHSIALLMPDGRVVAAGSNPDKGQVNDWSPDRNEDMRLEIYSPPYLFKGPRPQITAVPQGINYGSQINIVTANAGQIRWVSLIKQSVTTHSFNSTQRLVDVPFQIQGQNLVATVPDNRNIAPPGWYMLFITDQGGTPSVASWVHLT